MAALEIDYAPDELFLGLSAQLRVFPVTVSYLETEEIVSQEAINALEPSTDVEKE